MGRHTKLYQHILTKRSDANVPFTDLCALLKELGFQERIRGVTITFSPGTEWLKS